MIRRYNRLITNNARPWAILLAFIATALSIAVMQFVLVPPFLDSTGGINFIDLQFPVTVETIFSDLPSYTETSRLLYVGFFVTDTIFPGLAAITQSLLWAWLLTARDFALLKMFAYSGLLLLPPISALLDYAENIGFIATVFMYPDRVDWITEAAVWCREAKLTMMGLNMMITGVILVASIIVYLLTWKRSKES